MRLKYTKKDIEKAIDLFIKTDLSKEEISENLKIDRTTVYSWFKYYSRGNIPHYLADKYKQWINEIKCDKKTTRKNKIEHPLYECKIFFGLVKLTFKPKL